MKATKPRRLTRMVNNDRVTITITTITLIVVAAAAVAVAVSPALFRPVALMLNKDYLPSACLAVVGAFGFLFTPYMFSVHRRAR